MQQLQLARGLSCKTDFLGPPPTPPPPQKKFLVQTPHSLHIQFKMRLIESWNIMILIASLNHARKSRSPLTMQQRRQIGSENNSA